MHEVVDDARHDTEVLSAMNERILPLLHCGMVETVSAA